MIPTSSTTTPSSSSSLSSPSSFSKPIPMNGERHVLKAEMELRLEIPSNCSITLTLLAGSAEIFGAELALATDVSIPSTMMTSTNTNTTSTTTSSSSSFIMSKQSYFISGNTKLAIFTWHGCTIDVDVEYGKTLDISYTSPSTETTCNISYVNTHAQLEIYREEALRAALLLLQRRQDESSSSFSLKGIPLLSSPPPQSSSSMEGSSLSSAGAVLDGPRVLIVGPPDSGKTTLAKILTAYAVKVNKSPILIDLDPSQNILSIPGTISACVMTQDSISIPAYASMGITTTTTATAAATGGGNVQQHYPLVLWYGSTDVSTQPDLYQALLYQLGNIIDARVASGNNSGLSSSSSSTDVDIRASGIIVNACGWIEDIGYKLLLHAISAFHINIILVMGHDRLYSMLQTHVQKLKTDPGNTTSTTTPMNTTNLKVIKLPRSGGVVSRDISFRRTSRSLSIKQYFYGDLIPSSLSTQSTTTTSSSLVHQYTPVLLELSFGNLRIYKLSSVSLSASMLPIAAKQTTDPVQLNLLTSLSPSLTHCILAVCHPNAVETFDKSGNASDLYLSGVAGFLAVEKVNMEKEIITVLSPCSGSLPSSVLILGDVSWME